MRMLVALFVLLASMIRSADAQTEPLVDHVYILVGAWHCHSNRGADWKLTFVQNVDGSMTATKGSYSNGYAQVTTTLSNRIFSDSYVYDPQQQVWTDTERADESYDNLFVGTARPWTGDQWHIVGRFTYGNGVTAIPERKTYTLMGPDLIRMQLARGTFFSESICNRF
jgi:hypothetical protein